MRGYTPPPMQPKPSRAELDQIAEHYDLGSEGVDTMLELAEARPDVETTRQFLAKIRESMERYLAARS